MREKLVEARTHLVINQPFFGALSLGLRLQEDPTCKTGWVDGQTLGYNPAWIAGLNRRQVEAFIAHEVLHCAQGHMWRRDGRNPKRWNIAADRTINTLLKDCGFTLPPNGHYASGPEIGQSAEWIYARLPEEQENENGQGEADPLGEMRDAPTGGDGDAQEAPSEAEWAQRSKEAAMSAKAQGRLPETLKRFADEVGQPKVDWKSTLRRFVQDRCKSDYTWSKPSSRYIALGMYLPALESHELGEIAIAVDTSGSMDNVALAAAKAEVMSVIDETKPSAVTVYYADARVAQADRFNRGDEIEWRPKGGGGTDFRPVFQACQDQDNAPLCLVYITDLMGTFPESSEIPTIWVTDTATVAPFGETVRM